MLPAESDFARLHKLSCVRDIKEVFETFCCSRLRGVIDDLKKRSKTVSVQEKAEKGAIKSVDSESEKSSAISSA